MDIRIGFGFASNERDVVASVYTFTLYRHLHCMAVARTTSRPGERIRTNGARHLAKAGRPRVDEPHRQPRGGIDPRAIDPERTIRDHDVVGL